MKLSLSCQNVSASPSAKKVQKKISSFFSSKSAPVVTEAEAERTEPEENWNEEPEILTDLNDNSVETRGVRDVFKVLGLAKGHEVSTSINMTENIAVISQQIAPLLQLYAEKKQILEASAKYFQQNSKFSNLKSKVEKKVCAFKQLFSNLTDYVIVPKAHMDQKTLAEVSKYLEFCAKRRKELEANIFSLGMDLTNLLKDLNRRFDKRISNLKIKSIEKSVTITCENGEKTWSQCIEAVEPVIEGVFKLSVEDFEKIKNYFNLMAVEKHEFCLPQDIVKYLGFPASSLKFVTKMIVKCFPVIHLQKSPMSILIDAEQFFGSAIQIFHLFQLIEGSEKMIKPEEVHLAEPAPDKPRKPGSGRPSLLKKRPDIVQSVSEFASNCGVTAHERRRNTTGQLGFNIPDVHRFVEEKFFKETPEKAPSVSSIRRLFSAASKHHKASKFYHGIINARPATKRNDATVGEAHAHRHHCFSLVKMVREFCAKHAQDCQVCSADDKCKLPYGCPVVSRLVNLRKFFLEDDCPNLPDHDMRSSTITPNGYMFLHLKENQFNNFPTISATKMSEETEDDSSADSLADADLETFLFDNWIGIEDEFGEMMSDHESDVETATASSNKPKELCFCLTTTSKCCSCKAAVCDFCSPNPEDFAKRFCSKCFSLSESLSIVQVDGLEVFSDSDSDEDIQRPRPKKSRVLESESESEDEDDQHGLGSADEAGSGPEDENSQSEASEYRTITDEIGRDHVPYPSTGKFFVFFKPTSQKPSDIEKHCNDIKTIYEADPELEKKKVLALIVDDGADYGIRSSATFHYFGKLFFSLNLDLLIVVKNAPKDSRWNPVEHGWGFLTPKWAGVTLPTKLVSTDDDGVCHGDTEDPVVLDQGVDIMTNITRGLRFDGFDVVPVAVHSESDEVDIEGKKYNNEHFTELAEVKDYYDSKLSEERLRKKSKDLRAESKLICSHMDKRSHCMIFRKCSKLLKEKVCSYCKSNPPQASEALWRDLPARNLGGLFFDVQEDPEFPGHNKTLLKMIKEMPNIEPDGDIPDIKRCQVIKFVLAFCKSDGKTYSRNQNVSIASKVMLRLRDT